MTVAFTVQGYREGVSYAVTVGVQPRRAADGVVVGSPVIIRMLQAHEGLPMRPRPGETAISGTTADPAWVLACLYSETQVSDVDGDDVPVLRGRRRQPGAVS